MQGKEAHEQTIQDRSGDAQPFDQAHDARMHDVRRGSDRRLLRVPFRFGG